MLRDKYKVISMGVLASAFLYYSFTLYASLPVDHPVTNNESSKGKLLWQQYNCNSCHQVYGLGGYLGPDLTNVYSRRGSGYITGLLKSGTVTMPDFHLKEVEIKSFLAYFENMDATGKSDPRTFTIKKDGTIIQE